jgi:2-polyprenyl-3-methyl-5-hydroxy-6-metoxy-1,4-benzoquinol methylase
MREVAVLDPTWADDIKRVHHEHQQFVNGQQPHIVSWYVERTEMVATLIHECAPNAKTVLDIGCAQGTIAIRLSEAGYEVTGNDIRPYYLAYARLRDDSPRKVDFVCANFLDYQPAKPFDAVVLTEVIEHVVDHAEFVRHIRECLAPGGILIVTTPNYDFIRQPLPSYSEVSMTENADKAFTADGSDHFYLFRKSELLDILEREGFKSLTHRYFLPFIQYGSFKLRWLWRILPKRLMEAVSRPFDNSRLLCAQQVAVVVRQ